MQVTKEIYIHNNYSIASFLFIALDIADIKQRFNRISRPVFLFAVFTNARVHGDARVVFL